MMLSIFYYRLKRAIEYFKVRKTAKIITLALFAVVFIGLAIGLYFFFLEGLSYIKSYPFFAQALTLYSYEAYLLFITILIAISTFISSVSTLFKAGENSWVIAGPAYKKILALNFLKTFFTSFWPLLIMVIPGLFAIKTAYGLPMSSMLLSMLLMMLLTLLIVSFVYLLILTGGKALNFLSNFLSKELLSFKNLIIGIILIFFLLIGAIWYANFNADLVALFKARDLGKQTINSGIISENFRFSPAHPVAAGIFGFQNNDPVKAYSYILLLMTITALTIGAVWLASGWYLTIWQKLQEGSFTAKTTPKRKLKKKSPNILLNSPESALFKKELLASSRNMRNIMWFTFFGFIWLAQTGINLILSKNMAKYDIAIGSFPVIIQVLQFLTATFFISAFVLRFVFPSFSMEKNTAWIINSSPIKKQRIFWAKLFFYLPFLAFLGIVIGYSNLLLINLTFTYTLSTLILFLTSILFTVTLGLSLGAMFPSQEVDDPASLSTSMPGIGFMIGALGHGLLGGLLLFRLLNGSSHINFTLFIISTFIATGILLYIAPASFSQKRLIKKTVS
jgi:hypothetical protein